jgi:hypothetical protein
MHTPLVSERHQLKSNRSVGAQSAVREGADQMYSPCHKCSRATAP